jgi:tetratricopeptide (TPR) repeat protein
VTSETQAIAKTEYQAGKAAFERGKYREAVQHLEKASALIARNTRLGGEIQIWLVTAYEATEQRQEAVALCEQLKRHPHAETSKQARRLLYILQAPQLKRPQEWLTQIPDLGALPDNESQTRLSSGTVGKKRPSPTTVIPEPIDLSKVNTKDNRFIWVALIAIALTLVGLMWSI